MSLTLSCPMKLHKFPLDTQKCWMQMESCKYISYLPTTSIELLSSGLFPQIHYTDTKVAYSLYVQRLCSNMCAKIWKSFSQHSNVISSLIQCCMDFFLNVQGVHMLVPIGCCLKCYFVLTALNNMLTNGNFEFH